MPRRIDLKNKVFGRITCIEPTGKRKRGSIVWRCVCSCGKEVFVNSNALMMGETRSCGCLKTDTNSKQLRTHGMSRTRLYKIWIAMRRRCFNEKSKAYKNYGGRGISVCKDWMDFVPFMQWAVENGYRSDLTIERKNNDGNYCPENCTWATRKQQLNNKRSNRYITHNGQTKTLAGWATYLGVAANTLHYRLMRHPKEKALTKGRLR